MKVYRLQNIGSIDGLVVCEEPIPEPGPGEGLANIKATSLNFRDLTIVYGWSPFPLEGGRVQLSDAAGVVEAIGFGVTRFAVGDRVTNNFMPGWFAGPFRKFASQYGTQIDGWMGLFMVSRCLQIRSRVIAKSTIARPASNPMAISAVFSALTTGLPRPSAPTRAAMTTIDSDSMMHWVMPVVMLGMA